MRDIYKQLDLAIFPCTMGHQLWTHLLWWQKAENHKKLRIKEDEKIYILC